jgi:hypothetical protein
MNTTIGFVKSLDNVMAKGQQFIVRSQWHGSVSPFNLMDLARLIFYMLGRRSIKQEFRSGQMGLSDLTGSR